MEITRIRERHIDQEVVRWIHLHLQYNRLTYWMLRRLAEFSTRGTGIPLQACVEGEPGVGKTSLVLCCITGAIACVGYCWLMKITSITSRFGIVTIPARGRTREVFPEILRLARLLLEGDFDTYCRELRSMVVFTPVELFETIRKVRSEGRALPFLLVDDAGTFFCRTAWVAFPREWKRALAEIASLLPLMRNFTANFVITTPNIKHVFTGLVRVVSRYIILGRLGTTHVVTVLGKTYKTDRWCRYYVRTLATVAGQRAEKVRPLTDVPEPVFHAGLDAVKPLLEDLWNSRLRWIELISRRAEESFMKMLEGEDESDEDSTLQEGDS